MIQKLLIETNKYLKAFLLNYLPQISDNWWEHCVLKELSYHQKQDIETRKLKSLSEFDLAKLLKVFEKNWSMLSFKANLTRTSRNLIFEMIDIRNKYAHLESEETNKDEIYHELIIFEKFFKMMNIKTEILNEIDIYKKQILSLNKEVPKQTGSIMPNQSEAVAKFSIGEIVCMKSNPEITGAITNISFQPQENKYSVFVDRTISEFYETQLEKIKESKNQKDFINIKKFNAHISSLQILNPNISALYSMNSAYIDFIPYQYRPVIKIINSDRPRILIADEVGIGKTIEAGLILRELQARQEIKSVLVICPKPLVTERKWYNELKRFNEDFEQLDGAKLDFCLDELYRDGVWPEKYSKAILPYSILDNDLIYGGSKKGKHGLLKLDPPPTFDLIIVDEAHRIRNNETNAYKAISFLCDQAEAVVFLTATPIQLGANDLFTLLNVLRPDYIIEKELYSQISEPNVFINKAVELIRKSESSWQQKTTEELLNAGNTNWGSLSFNSNPSYHKILNSLSKEAIEGEERVSLIQEIEQLHTLSNIISRTRRRDIGEFTIRKAQTVEVLFTENQQKLYQSIISFQTTVLSSIHGDRNVKFMMTTLLRQTASCLYGLIPLINDILTRHLSDIDFDEMNSEEETFDFDNSSISDKLNIIRKLCENVDDVDPKFDALYGIIKEKLNLKNKRLLIFSSFKHTIFYLEKKIKEKGIRCGSIYGSVDDDDRLTIKERFALPDINENAIDILLSSEVGSEGLDYQFCDAIVNYDIPWNPMRIEQRIGRIDRYGQESESVLIYNFITPNTIDFNIYERCLLRIGIFKSAIGGCEEILGTIAKEIRLIAEDYHLNDEQQKERLQQLADNKIRETMENDKLEKEQQHLFSVNLPPEWLTKEIENVTNFWLLPLSLENLIQNYLQERLEKKVNFAEKDIKQLKLSLEERKLLYEDFKNSNIQNSPISKSWEKYLKGNEFNLSLTYTSNLVKGKRNITLISPIHPLAKQAAKFYEKKQPVYTSISITSKEIISGSYPFAIYCWKKQGLKEEITFQPVCQNELIIKDFVKIVQNGNDFREFEISKINVEILDNIHYDLWNQARSEHLKFINLSIENKKNILKINHNNRLKIIERDLANVTNDKIKLMKVYQKNNANRDFNQRIEELEQKKLLADINFETVAYGIIKVVN
jgi:superfamily II DNA or RNA helicase